MIQNEQQCLDLIREEQQRINLIRKEGRYRRLLINGRDIIMLFRGMKNSLYAAIPPDRYDGCSCLPENCIIEEWSLAMDSFPRSLSIVIGHESFDPIEEGAILPNYQCQCKRRLVPVTDDPDVVIEDSSHE